MGAGFDEMAAIEHGESIRVADGRQAMGVHDVRWVCKATRLGL
jgi:hypothetical protein